MGEIKAAISAVEDDIPTAVQNSVAADTDDASGPDTSHPKKVKPKPGQIGEGKGAPLTKNQRKRALCVCLSMLLVRQTACSGEAHVAPVSYSQVERMRIPMILATPEFAANPFQTIRTHAQNTLLKHEPPAAS